MKNFKFSFPVKCLLTCLMLSIAFSCEKSPTSFQPSIDHDSPNSSRIGISNREAVNNGLKIIGSRLTWLPNKDVARKILYGNIESKFDGDYNVLIDDILVAFKNSSIDFDKESAQGNNTLIEEFNQVINNFKSGKFNSQEGKADYPQIYIPNYKDLKQRNIIGKASPTLVFHDGDESSEFIDAFVINKNNKIEKLAAQINEEYIKSNEVWVFSVNEVVHSQADIDKQKQQSLIKIKQKGARAFQVFPGNAYSDCSDLSLNQAPNFGTNGIRMKIPSLSPKTFKEPWYAGQVEVSMKYTSAWGNGYTQYAPYNQYMTSGTRNTSPIVYNGPNAQLVYSQLVNVNRSDVGQYYQVTVDNPYFYCYQCGTASFPGWGSQGDVRRDCIYYLIFEEDSGADNRSDDITSDSFDINDPAKNTVSIPYSSNDGPFATGYFYWYLNVSSTVCNTSVISPDISYVVSTDYKP